MRIATRSSHLTMPKVMHLAQSVLAALALAGCNAGDLNNLQIPNPGLNYTFGDSLTNNNVHNFDHQRMADYNPTEMGKWLLVSSPDYVIVEKLADGTYVDHHVAGSLQWLNVGSADTIASLKNQGNPLAQATGLDFSPYKTVRGVVFTVDKVIENTSDHSCENTFVPTDISVSNALVYNNGTLQPRAISPEITCN